MKTTDNITLQKNRIKEQTNSFYHSIQIFEEVSSTNTYLKNQTDKQEGMVVISNRQSAGRGRGTHSFSSKKDVGVYLSILLKPNCMIDDISYFTILSAVAVHKTIQAIYQLNSSIKWINDIYLNDKKIAGILVESVLKPNTSTPEAIIIGIGVNLFKQSFEPELATIASSIEDESSLTCNRNLFISHLLNEIHQLYLLKEKSSILEYYKQHCITLNQELFIEDETLLVIDINEQGHLITQRKDSSIKILTTQSIPYKNPQ